MSGLVSKQFNLKMTNNTCHYSYVAIFLNKLKETFPTNCENKFQQTMKINIFSSFKN